nr:hypothetical protein [Deltaproteobacteria bacterium]
MNVSDRAAGSILEGRYRLEARLSNWGVGEVWRASDSQRGRASVTVKLLPAPGARRTERMVALKVLGDRLAKLQHPGMLPVVEINTAGAQPFVVYESWEGIGLGEWLTAARASGEPTSLRTVFGIADRVLSAIGAGHRQRSPGSLVHGAIHHDAVRVRVEEGREPEVRVLDFGLAAEKDSSALAALVDSTPRSTRPPSTPASPRCATPRRTSSPRRCSSSGCWSPRRCGRAVTAAGATSSRSGRARFTAPSPRCARTCTPPCGRRSPRPCRVARRHDPRTPSACGNSSGPPPGASRAPTSPTKRSPRSSRWRSRRFTLSPRWRPSLPTSPSTSLAPAPDFAHAPSARPAGPPPVPKGMQLGVASVLGANRPDTGSVRPRRATAGVDHRNFGPLAPRPLDDVEPPSQHRGRVSLDDAQSTRQDIELPSDEPATIADSEMTMALNVPVAARSSNPQFVSLEQADRTVQSPFDHVEQTQIAQLPVPPSAPMPPYNPSGHWSAGPSLPFQSAVGAFPTTLPLTDATMPLNLEAVPPEVAAALAAYAAPVSPASWDSTSNLQPVSLPPSFAAPPPAYAPPPGYASSVSAPRAADPFALVAAAGRGDARAWDANTTPPDRAPAPARKTSTALLIGLGVLAAALAFLVGVMASNRDPAPSSTSAPAER